MCSRFLPDQTKFSQVAIQQWLLKTAQDRMETILNGFYTDKKLDGVLSPYDGLSRGILNAVQSAKID